MSENNISNTSLWTAYMRAYHRIHATDKIFNDFLAYNVVPEDVRKQIEEQIIPEVFLPGTNNIVTRARYAEDILEEAVRQGANQYVILGAGMDTFALRRHDLMEHVNVFEIDQPATQEFKIQRFAELGWKIPENLYFVPIDFTRQNLETELSQLASYDPDAKTFFSWLGVISYLTKEEAVTTLRSIANITASGSSIVFDYVDVNEIDRTVQSQQLQQSSEYLEKIGEQRRTEGFNPLTLGEELAGLGFDLVENLSPSHIEGRYLKKSADMHHTLKYINLAWSVVK